MKRVFSLTLAIAMILACMTVMTTEIFAVKTVETPMGIKRIDILWDEDASYNIKFDGDPTYWNEEIWPKSGFLFDNSTLVTLHGEENEDFLLSTAFAADSEYLYVAVSLMDDTFNPLNIFNGYDVGGDMLSLSFDFGHYMMEMGEDTNIDYNVFFSGEDTAPYIVRFNSANDTMISEENGDGVKAHFEYSKPVYFYEFAFSWEQIYRDMADKMGESPQFIFDEWAHMAIGCTVSYADFDDNEQLVSYVATLNNNAENNPVLATDNNGIELVLAWESGRYVKCSGILCEGGNEGEETGEVETGCRHENHTEEFVPPTCTDQGYTIFDCRACGEYYEYNYTAANGHNYYTETYEPTCGESGYTVYTCYDCGYSYTADRVPSHGHDYYVADSKEADCMNAGWVELDCYYCDERFRTDFVDPLGHSMVYHTYEPTCTAGGYTEARCERCGFYRNESYTEARGHKYKENTIPPTATEYGYTEHICAECQYVYYDSFVEPLGVEDSDTFPPESDTWIPEDTAVITPTETLDQIGTVTVPEPDIKPEPEPEPEPEPDEPKNNPYDVQIGCSSSLTPGAVVGVTVLLAAAFSVIKKKNDLE